MRVPYLQNRVSASPSPLSRSPHVASRRSAMYAQLSCFRMARPSPSQSRYPVAFGTCIDNPSRKTLVLRVFVLTIPSLYRIDFCGPSPAPRSIAANPRANRRCPGARVRCGCQVVASHNRRWLWEDLGCDGLVRSQFVIRRRSSHQGRWDKVIRTGRTDAKRKTLQFDPLVCWRLGMRKILDRFVQVGGMPEVAEIRRGGGERVAGDDTGNGVERVHTTAARFGYHRRENCVWEEAERMKSCEFEDRASAEHQSYICSGCVVPKEGM